MCVGRVTPGILWLGLVWTALAWGGEPAQAPHGEAATQIDVDAFLQPVRLPTKLPTTPATPSTAATQRSSQLATSSPYTMPLSTQTPAPDLKPAMVMLGDYFAGRAGLADVALPRTVTLSRFVFDKRTGNLVEFRRTVNTLENFRVYAPGGSRQFKIADDESPMPQDRFGMAFNYFNDFDYSINNRIGAGDVRLDEYRATFQFEKTFCGGAGSVGMRLPMSQIASLGSETGQTGGQLGDLSVILKYAPWHNERGDVLSTGLAVTAPTGSNDNDPFHGTLVQPFIGYLKNWGQWYLHGFVSVEVPVQHGDDVTLLFNDVGVGYRWFESNDCSRCITAITPTAEVHVNTPLNHRGILSSLDPAGTPDSVDLTFGGHVEFRSRTRLSLAAVVPVTGPRPFEIEIVALLNVRF